MALMLCRNEPDITNYFVILRDYRYGSTQAYGITMQNLKCYLIIFFKKSGKNDAGKYRGTTVFLDSRSVFHVCRGAK